MGVFHVFFKKSTKSRETSHINKILFTDPNTTDFEIKKAVSICDALRDLFPFV